MTRSRLLALAVVAGAGLGMLGPAAEAVARPSAIQPGCVVTDASLSWGFKESFRAYIDGDIANGEWKTSGGATYETPEFAWSKGQGHYDPSTGYGYVQFTGSVRFTGHDGLLDTTIADPALSITGDGAVLILDVSGPSMEGEQIDAQDVAFVSLPAVEVAADGVRASLQSDSVLTDDGEAAFPDYQAGTAFDPVAVDLKLDKCSPAYSGGDDITPRTEPSSLVVGISILGALAVATAVYAVITLVLRGRARA